MPAKLNPTIFEAAAAHLLTGHSDCCCHAIMGVIHGPNWSNFDDKNPHITALLDCFAPWSSERQPVYFWVEGTEKECREQRVLALLFMAEIARAEKGGAQ